MSLRINPFFIVGAQRSGTTLLRLILNAHSKIAIPEEARFLMPLLKHKYLHKPLQGKFLKSTISYLRKNTEYKLWNYDNSSVLDEISCGHTITLRELIEKLYASYAKYEGKPAWADKSLFFRRIDILSSLFPEARFIHLVRDGRDVFHSWRKMDPTKNNVAAVAFDWKYKLQRIKRSFERLPDERTLTIRYEDLIESPQKTINLVCDFVGIDFEPGMLQYHETSQFYIGEHHSKLIFKSIDPNNRFKWRKNLSPYEIRSFESICKTELTEYGYELSGMRFGIADAGYLANKILTGVPLRAFQVLQRKLSAEHALQQGKPDIRADVGVMPQSKMESSENNK